MGHGSITEGDEGRGEQAASQDDAGSARLPAASSPQGCTRPDGLPVSTDYQQAREALVSVVF
jgi:hypothetical protein